MATILLVIGSVFELGGIVALGFPDLLPGVRPRRHRAARFKYRTGDRTKLPNPPLLHNLHRVAMGSPHGSTVRDGPAWIRTRDQRIMSPLL
jgi:hypothetical protein